MSIKLSKVGRGIALGDVANNSIRNILTELSKEFGPKFSNKDLEDSLKFFDWKCPYTGRDLRKSIDEGINDVAIDHIVPQNKDFCGLNVRGNLVLVDKQANNKKGSKSFIDFINEDNTVLACMSKKERNEKIDKIKEFQKINGYNPEEIKKIISPLLLDIYSKVQENQITFTKRVSSAVASITKSGFVPSTLSAYNASRIGTIVKNELVPLLEAGKATNDEIEELLTVDGSNRKLLLNTFPMLAVSVNLQNHNRYYKDKIVIKGREFYLSSQWFDRQRKALCSWIDELKTR